MKRTLSIVGPLLSVDALVWSWLVFVWDLFSTGKCFNGATIVVKYHVKLGITSTETYLLLREVYGNELLSCARVFQRFKRFQDGRNVEDEARRERSSTSEPDKNIDTICNLIISDRR